MNCVLLSLCGVYIWISVSSGHKNMKENRTLFFRNLAERFQNEVIGGKLYLKPRLSLDDVALHLGESRYNLSHAVNECLGKSFCRLVNELRIAEAVRIMREPGADGEKIRRIAQLAGFTDRKTFMRVCKAITGFSPSELKVQIKEDKL